MYNKTIKSNNRIIISVVDNVKRDLKWRVEISKKLADDGYTIMLTSGEYYDVIYKMMKNVLILGRLSTNDGIVDMKDSQLIEHNNNNNIMIVFHDEGGFYRNIVYKDSLFRTHMINIAKSDVVKKILLWGEYQRELIYKNIPEVKNKLEVVGAPRFELYNGNNFVNEKKHILICTRGTTLNSNQTHPHHLGKRIRELYKNNIKEYDYIEKLVFHTWYKNILDSSSMILAIHKLAMNLPTEKFVIRPHPGENSNFYTVAFNGYSNIKIDETTDLSDIMSKSKLCIANDCTSGLEAILCDVPYINYRPFHDMYQEYTPYGLSKLGIIINNIDKLISVVKNNEYSITDIKVIEKIFQHNHVHEKIVKIVNKYNNKILQKKSIVKLKKNIKCSINFKNNIKTHKENKIDIIVNNNYVIIKK